MDLPEPHPELLYGVLCRHCLVDYSGRDEEFKVHLAAHHRDMARKQQAVLFAGNDMGAGPSNSIHSSHPQLTTQNPLNQTVPQVNVEQQTPRTLDEIFGELDKADTPSTPTAQVRCMQGQLIDMQGQLHGMQGQLHGVQGQLNGVQGQLNGVEYRTNLRIDQSSTAAANRHTELMQQFVNLADLITPAVRTSSLHVEGRGSINQPPQ